VVIAFSLRYQDSDEGRIHQTSIGGELSLRRAKSKTRKKRKLRKLAEKIESQYWDAIMKNRRIAGLTLLSLNLNFRWESRNV